MNEETRKLIAALLADSDPDVRRRSADALGQSNVLAVVAALAAALQDESKGVRDAAFRSLCAMGGVNVARAIVEYLGSDNIVTRNLAAELLVKLGATSVPAILPYLKDPSRDVRKFAVDTLGLIGAEEPVEAMLPLLRDEDDNVVVSAVEAFGNMHARSAIPALYEAYDRYDYARAPVAEALGKIAAPEAGDFLLLRLQEGLAAPTPDPVVLFALIEGLGAIGSDRSITVLQQNARTVSGRLRSAMLHAVVQIADRIGKPLVFPPELHNDFLVALRDPDGSIRQSAARVLVEASGEHVTMALVTALVASPALEPLLMQHLPERPDIFPVAVKYLEEHREGPVKQVLQLLGRLALDLTKTLMHGTYDQSLEAWFSRAFVLVADRWAAADEETRALIVDVLFRIDGDNAVEFLDAIMNDPDPWLRIHVIEIIAAIADPRAPEFIARFLQDDDETVREVAVGILQSRGYVVGEGEQMLSGEQS